MKNTYSYKINSIFYSICAPVLSSIALILILFLARSLCHFVAAGKRQQWLYPLSFYQFAAAELRANLRFYGFSCAAFILVFYLILRHRKFLRDCSSRFRYVLGKQDLNIPVFPDKKILVRNHHLIQKSSARITTGGHLFINGQISLWDSSPSEGSLCKVLCSLENKAGNILYSLGESHFRQLKPAQPENFSLCIYRIERFVNPSEIARAVIYTETVSNSNTAAERKEELPDKG